MDTKFTKYFNNAAKWAEKYMGSTEYNTHCLAFVEDAYEQSNNLEIFGGSTAKESADEYEANKNTDMPALGSFVFYNCSGILNGEYKNWGHVGLYLGNGEVIHAWDKVRKDNYIEIQNLTTHPGWTKLEYIGWVPVERIFLGYIDRAE